MHFAGRIHLNLTGELGNSLSLTTQLTVDGDVTCNMVEVFIQGSIDISGSITFQGGTTPSQMFLNAGVDIPGSSVNTITIGGSVTFPRSQITLKSTGDISAGTISNSADSAPASGFIQQVVVQANIGQTGTVDPFVVGGSGTNGVASISNTTDLAAQLRRVGAQYTFQMGLAILLSQTDRF